MTAAERKPELSTSRQRLLARVDRILACPHCRVPLSRAEPRGAFLCPECGETFDARTEQYSFWNIPRTDVEQDWLNRAKESAKRGLKWFYPTACRMISPVLGGVDTKPFLATFDTETQLIADLGSGTNEYRESVVCVDGVGYPNVHVVANLECLPFQNDSLAGIVSCAVLEHARHPAAHVAEMRRVLQPGGRVLCFIPFIQGFHASPHDYQRYTKEGLRELFAEFEVLNVAVGAGPTSGLLWILQEWLALVLSFGSVRLYRLLVPCTWVLSPLKFLDVLLSRHPAATVIASGHFIEARKAIAVGK
jgi:SAM-dependent methyltransferase